MYALEEYAKVEASPVHVEVQTKGPVRHTVTDVGAVVAGDLIVAVGVHKAEVTRI